MTKAPEIGIDQALRKIFLSATVSGLALATAASTANANLLSGPMGGPGNSIAGPSEKQNQEIENNQKTAGASEQKTSSPLVPANLLQVPASSSYYSPYAFVVDKSARTLTVWQQSGDGLKAIAQFPADMGKNSGVKTSRGDKKTPEGIYFLQERRDGPSLDFSLYGKRAFTTDYPNFFDRLEAHTGDGIWLHAVPDHVPLTRGSKGCVVVRNDVILDITQYVKLGKTPILIQDKVQMLSTKDMERTSSEVSTWLEGWRAAWESKNLNSYIKEYANDFRSMNMNRKQWLAYKSRLAQNYKSIVVRLSKPAIYMTRDQVIVRFLQHYESERHADIGEKFLFVKKTQDGYRILGETWSEDSSEIAQHEIELAKGVRHSSTLTCTSTDAFDCVKTSSLKQ